MRFENYDEFIRSIFFYIIPWKDKLKIISMTELEMNSTRITERSNLQQKWIDFLEKRIFLEKKDSGEAKVSISESVQASLKTFEVFYVLCTKETRFLEMVLSQPHWR